MKIYSTSQIKNVLLLGSSNSGKTSLAEALLYEGKVIDRRGSIDAKNTVSDYTEVEQIYKRSIYSTLLYTEYNNHKINFIDTSGSDDFVGGIVAAMRVVDSCLMVVNAQAGVEVGTEIFGRWAEKYKKPMIVAINQLDGEKANWDSTIEAITQSFGNRVALVQYPINAGSPAFNMYIDVLTMKMYTIIDDNGTRNESEIPENEREKAADLHNQLVEAAAEHDDELMETYFEKGELTEDEIRKGLKIGIQLRTVFPVFCTSAKKDIGTKRLMEFITAVAPSPSEGLVYQTVEGTEVACDAKGPTSIFLFKNSTEQHVGELTYFRVISGTVTEGMELVNMSNGTKERISQLFLTAGKKREKVTEVQAGDLACTLKLKNSRVNDTLNTAHCDWKYPPIPFPEPKYRTAIKAKSEKEEEKLNELLQRAHHDDPTLSIEYSKELKQNILCGQGEHHINILKWNLLHNNKLEIDLFAPKIPYRETITKTAVAEYRHKKQSGGSGQFGEVHLLIEPHIETEGPDKTVYKIDGREIKLNIKSKEHVTLDWGGSLVYYNSIVGGAIDTRYMPAILKGIMDKMEEGPLTGSYARDIKVTIFDGRMHAVDSNDLSFRLAARNAFREAFKKAGPKIMEPIYKTKIFVPSDCMGDVMSDLQNRRAIIEGMDSDGIFEVISARVPLAEMYRYSTTLSSISSGRATFAMKFADYQQVPAEVQEKLLQGYQEESD